MSFGSIVSPSTFGLMFMGSVMLQGVRLVVARGDWKAFQWSPTGRVEMKLTILWL